MNADADIQVWLETLSRTQPGVIVPYVMSTEQKHLGYRIRATNSGKHGSSTLGQGGSVTLTPDVPAALSRMAISHASGDNCQINVVLTEAGKQDRNYQFACPD
jgi:curli production protein